MLTSFLFCLVLFAPEDTKPATLLLKASDGVQIAASLWLPSTPGLHAAVVLIHQGGSDRSEWEPVAIDLQKLGYVVCAYDVRGHGLSDKVPSINELFNDPNQAPHDLEAVLAILRSHPAVNPARLAVVGASIGGNLACVASATMNIKTAVNLSGKTSAATNLAGHKALAMKSICHIASKGDQGGVRAVWAQELFDKSALPRRIFIVSGSGHGVSMFQDNNNLRHLIYTWLYETL